MSFREKTAWITLVMVMLTGAFYFGSMLTDDGDMHPMRALHYFLLWAHVLIVGQIVLVLIAFVMTPKSERGPKDEREKLILGRANSLAYYVLLVSLLGLFILAHMGAGIHDLLNFTLGAVAVATLANVIAQIIMFRRGG